MTKAQVVAWASWWWSATNGMRTTPPFVLWAHSALSPADANRARLAAARAQRSRTQPGAWEFVRAAAVELAGTSGDGLVSHGELLDRAATLGPAYSRSTLKQVVDEHSRDVNGALARVRAGLFSLRTEEEVPARTRTSRSWVLEALVALCGQSDAWATRRQVEAYLASRGLRYSERAVSSGLTRLVRDADSPVTMPRPGQYTVGDAAAGAPRCSGREER